MTDEAYNEEGWYIWDAWVNGGSIDLQPAVESLDIDFQVTIVWKLGGRYVNYVVKQMELNDLNEFGMEMIPISKHHSAYVIVSPTMETGWADYQFAVHLVKELEV